MTPPLVYTDFYKTDHRRQYPKGTNKVYSNFTARGSRIKGVNYTIVFGVQYFVKEFLITQFNEGFFNLPKQEVVGTYKRRLDNALGKDSVPIDHIERLHDLGYLPLEIKALKEGTKCPMRVPCLTITNTLPDFYWLPNFLETLLSTVLWQPITSATIASVYRTLLDDFAVETSDIPEFVDFQGHDFSMRGMAGLEAACVSGAGHLLSFKGSDTIPAIDFLEQYYGANSDKEFISCSVPATEHSVMCLGGLEDEFNTFKKLILETYPKGIVSIVSDTWDYWKVLTEYLPRLKKEIRGREGKVVIRPDSGDPIKIICGDPEANIGTPEFKGSVQVLYELFGGVINNKGYRQLEEHIGLIYGDSITIDRCYEICKRLKQKGFASTNVVYGIGSYTYQYVTRDTFGFAMKATYGEINGTPHNIFKDPKTDDGLKKSAKGLLQVKNSKLIEEVTWEQEKDSELQTVFLNGKLKNEITLQEIRDIIK